VSGRRISEGVKAMPKIQFWYDFASNYSYLSAMRIEEEAAMEGIGVEWRPFLLGPIFAAQGWDTSPFKIYPAKGRHMIRDMERICADRGMSFRLPEPFPQNSLQAARLALIGEEEGWAPAFTRELFRLEFGEGASIADRQVLALALAAARQDAEAQMQRTQAPEIKTRLRARNEEAQALGIFGAPTFITEGGELFWGDDRLEQALAWSLR
jgi:2-hydroxychromene-2-carboxylate isomerase